MVDQEHLSLLMMLLCFSSLYLCSQSKKAWRVDEVDDDGEMLFGSSVDTGALDAGVFSEDFFFKERWEELVTVA